MAHRKVRKRTPAAGYEIEVSVSGLDRGIVERILDIAMKAALIQAREIPVERARPRKKPCGCGS
jgi:hypothetical protein